MKRSLLIVLLVIILPVTAYLLYGVFLNRSQALPAAILSISVAGSLLIILSSSMNSTRRMR